MKGLDITFCTTCGDPIADPRDIGGTECPQCSPRGDGYMATRQEAFCEGWDAHRDWAAAQISGSDESSPARRTIALTRHECHALVAHGALNLLPPRVRVQIAEFLNLGESS